MKLNMQIISETTHGSFDQ